ncbi:MAG: TonB-dependent receptor [Anaeromyxobacter sp.]
MAPLALLFASVASAQTTGTIIGVVTDGATGKPVPGAVIIARSPNLQGEQTAVSDDKGNYRIPQLPPGSYVLAVQIDGYKPAERSDIVLRLDKTIRANIAVIPEAVQMEEQTVRTGSAPVVNIGNAESGAVVAREFVANVPVGRTVESVTATVPAATVDSYGVGFAGAQSPENAYILDGFNVTDPVYGTFGGNPGGQNPQQTLLTNFMQEIDVKTGGFGAEYGRATGGVLNMITKSGSNEFHGSVFANWTPRNLTQPDGQVQGRTGEAIGYYYKPSEGSYDLDMGFELGGPIMKDKLWFYAGFAPVVTKRTTDRFYRTNVLTTDAGAECDLTKDDPSGLDRCITANGDYVQNKVAGSDEIIDSGRTTYQMTGKLTYLFNENHNLTVGGYAAPSKDEAFATNVSPGQRITKTDDNIYDVIGHYAGKFLDKRLIVEATAGYHRSTTKDTSGAELQSTPVLRFTSNRALNTLEDMGDMAGACGTTAGEQLQRCTVNRYWLGGVGYMADNLSTRTAGRLSASYLFDAFGSHNAKVGIDAERNTFKISKNYSGGGFFEQSGANGYATAYRVYGRVIEGDDDPVKDGITNSGVRNPAANASGFVMEALSSTSVNTSTAIFAQDSWQLPVANLTINYGLRWEGQKMENQDNPNFNGFSINNNWAPRLQAVWDFTGNGRGKVAASWGRFFYNLPLDLGDRAFGQETRLNMRTSLANCGDFGALNTAGQLYNFDPKAIQPGSDTCPIVQRGTASNPFKVIQGGTAATPVDPDLQGIYVDQYGAQVEYEVLADLSVGVEYSARRQGTWIEDMSPDDGNHYYLGNPGKSGEFEIGDDGYTTTKGCSDLAREEGRCLSSSSVTATDPATGRSMVIQFPKPTRDYDGYTVFARKNFSKNWLASASYTYSTLTGNLAGPYRPETGQLDPGLTSEYDLAALMANRKGWLPGDQRHQLKLYGSYTYVVNSRFNLTGGAAYTGNSGSPASALGGGTNDYGPGEAYVLPRGMGGTTPWLNKVDLHGALEYVVKPPYAIKFSVDVFNVLNSQETMTVDENYTYDVVQPIVGLKCTGNAVSAANPSQALQNQCPDLKYLKTIDGRPATVNPSWGRALANVGRSAYQAPLSIRLGVQLAF